MSRTPTYSSPFKVYLLKDASTGKRRQLTDKDKAETEAAEIAKRTGKPVAEIVTASRYFYVTEIRPGRRVRRLCTKKPTATEAKQWTNARIARGPTTAAPKDLFSVAVDLWIEDKRIARKDEKTLTDYESVAKFWKQALGDIRISNLMAEDVLDYFRRRESGEIGRDAEKEPDERRKPSTRLLLKDKILMASFLRDAKAESSLLTVFKHPRLKWTEEESEPEALSREQVAALLDTCRKPYTVTAKRKKFRPYEAEQSWTPPPHLYGCVLTALHTLLRFKNVARLTWAMVDLDGGALRIPAGVMKNRRAITIPMTKTLKAYLSSLERGGPAAPVFPNAQDNIRRSFTSAARRAKVSWATFHSLRRTGATLLLDEGIPIAVVQRLGGWKHADVLLKAYAASTLKSKAKAVEVLDGLGG
jgi:integrase